jgi:hypothetical protein
MNRKHLLALLLAVALTVTAAMPAMAVSTGFNPPIKRFTQSRDEYLGDLNKYQIKMSVGKTSALKVLTASGEDAPKLKWVSTNSKIAKVESDGKVTGVSQGTCFIYAIVNGSYNTEWCFVKITGSSTGPKLISESDTQFYFNKVSLKPPFTLAILNKKIPGGFNVNDGYGYLGMIYGSKNYTESHTNIWFSNCGAMFISFFATIKSPISTYRGIKAGDSMGKVKSKYGEPTMREISVLEGKDVRFFYYFMPFGSYSPFGESHGLWITFCFRAPANNVWYMRYDYNAAYYY